MLYDITLPPYESVRHYEGTGNFAVSKYYRFPYKLFYLKKIKMIVDEIGDDYYRNILDFGSGPGIFTDEFKKHASRVMSIDIEDPINPLWKFDVIICASVLEFAPINHTLKTLKNLLHPKGSIIVASPMDTWLSNTYFHSIKDKLFRASHKDIVSSLNRHFKITSYKEWMGLYFCAKAIHR